MRLKRETGSGKRVSRLLLIVVALAALAIAPAASSAITIELGGEVFKDKCTPCHADISKIKNTAIIFTHGSHISYACSSCHTEWPHRPQGTLRVVMKDCFNCHALNHGPQGLMATGTCTDCHKPGPTKLRPVSHIDDWKNKPHVAPSLAKLQTECAMCHTRAECDKCHLQEGVQWTPEVPFAYDPGNGCQACHGNPNLTKLSGGLIKSYQVVGVDESAHRDVTCSKCHPDFSYGKGAPAPKTNLWNINAGLACADCHDHDKQTADYNKSIHAEEIAKGNLKSATCGSCHGGHDIVLTKDNQAAKDAVHASSEKMCGGCHKDYYESYADYYHGAPYKAGAKDAPACWQCHGAHNTQPSADKESLTYAATLATTCGAGDCHDQHGDASQGFATSAAAMIHGKKDVRASNPVLKLVGKVFGGGS